MIPFVYIYIYIQTIYHIIIKRFKDKKSPPPSPSPTANKKKVSGYKSEILIKYKRIKWTPRRKASLLLPGGKTWLKIQGTLANERYGNLVTIIIYDFESMIH